MARISALLAVAAIGSLLSSSVEAQNQGAPMVPSAPPALHALARVSSIAPDDWKTPVTCDRGYLIHSALATGPDDKIVAIVLLDASLNPIAERVWTEAFGFRLASKPNGKVDVILICGN